MSAPDDAAATEIGIRGGADDAEVAAVLAVLTGRSPSPAPLDSYRAWRAGRLKALRSKAFRSPER